MSLTSLGWDIVYATTFNRVNRIISQNGVLPKEFDGKNQGYEASGSWSGWQLITGSPSNLLWLKCTVSKGVLTLPDKTSADISGSEWVVQFGMQFEASSQQPTDSDVINNLVVSKSGTAAPVVISFKCDNITGVASYNLSEIMTSVLVSQVEALGAVICSIQTNNAGGWNTPTSVEFACEALEPDNPKIGVLALIAMTQGRSSQGRQVAVDKRLLDNAPDGCDGAVYLGTHLTISQYILPAVQALVPQSKPGDFVLDPNTGTIISNENDMSWGNFTYENEDGSTSTVDPNIPKGNMQVAVDGNTLHASFSNINFPYPGWSGPGKIHVSFNVQEYITFDFVLRSDGGLVIVPNSGNMKNNSNITVIPDHDVQVFQIALSAAIQVLMAVIGGAVVSATSSASQAAEEGLEELAEGGYSEVFSEEVLDDIITEAGENAQQQVEEDAAQQGGDLIANADNVGYLQKFKNFIVSNKWTIIMKIIEKMVTIPVGLISTIALYIAQKEYDKAPSINAVPEQILKPVKWGDEAAFNVKSGEFYNGIAFYGEFE